MVTVFVTREGQDTEYELLPADAEELLDMVNRHRFLGPGGSLETADNKMIGRTYPLEAGMKFTWYPAPGAASGCGQASAGAGAESSPELHIQQAKAGARFVAHFGNNLSCATIIGKGWLVSYAHEDHASWQVGDEFDVWFKADPMPSSIEDLTPARAMVKYISNAQKSDYVLLKLRDEDIHKMPPVPFISTPPEAGGQYIMVGAAARSQQLPFPVRHGVILSPYIDVHNHVKGDSPSFEGDSGGACFKVSDGSLFAINLGRSEGASVLLPVSLPLAVITELQSAAAI